MPSKGVFFLGGAKKSAKRGILDSEIGMTFNLCLGILKMVGFTFFVAVPFWRCHNHPTFFCCFCYFLLVCTGVPRFSVGFLVFCKILIVVSAYWRVLVVLGTCSIVFNQTGTSWG